MSIQPLQPEQLSTISGARPMPGNPARSKWSSDETISDGPSHHGEAVADRMGEAR
jgi:hypothetical protein